MPILKVNMPKGFVVNTENINWMKNYLTQKMPLLKQLTDTTEVVIKNLDMPQFSELCLVLDKTAEGREIKSKMFKAWRSKKSRDSDNGKKLFTFNLDINAGIQLKKLAENRTINGTLEALIFNNYQSQQSIKAQIKKEKALQREHNASTTSQIHQEIDDNYNVEVKQLAHLEKSVLIRNILKLNKQLKEYESKLKLAEQDIEKLNRDNKYIESNA